MAVDVSGIWHNEYGSEVELKVVDQRRLVGWFRSRTGLARSPHELSGFVSGSLVTFTVDFSSHGSFTAWTGHLVAEHGTRRIHASWNMCVEVPHNRADDLWRGIWTGADTFEPGPAPEEQVEVPALQVSHPSPEWP